MQPTGFNISLVEAPPSFPPLMPAWPREQALWRSSQECCCLALEGGGRPPGTQMYRPVILVPSTAVWEPWPLLLLGLERVYFHTSTHVHPVRKGTQTEPEQVAGDPSIPRQRVTVSPNTFHSSRLSQPLARRLSSCCSLSVVMPAFALNAHLSACRQPL